MTSPVGVNSSPEVLGVPLVSPPVGVNSSPEVLRVPRVGEHSGHSLPLFTRMETSTEEADPTERTETEAVTCALCVAEAARPVGGGPLEAAGLTYYRKDLT